MRRLLCVIVLFMTFSVIYSQNEKINWIIFVNGKIPDVGLINGEIFFQQDSISQVIIPFEYTVGSVIISSKDLQKLINQSSLDLKLKICYSEFHNYTRNEYIYIIPISKNFFLEPFVVFNITNISKKKKTYYLEIIGDGVKVFWKHNIRFLKKHSVIAEVNSKKTSNHVKHNLFIMRQFDAP